MSSTVPHLDLRNDAVRLVSNDHQMLLCLQPCLIHDVQQSITAVPAILEYRMGSMTC